MRRCSLLCSSAAPRTPLAPPSAPLVSEWKMDFPPPQPFVRSTPGQTYIDRRCCSSIRAFSAAGGGRAVCLGRGWAKCSVTTCTSCVNCSGDGSGMEVRDNCAGGGGGGGGTSTSDCRDRAKCCVTSRINCVNCSGDSRGGEVRGNSGDCAGGGGGGGGGGGSGDRARGTGDGGNIGAPACA
ncbi:hypothetical protein BDD12DRAFT_868731 [Trichophaea hybrida]|nr:hypothetical protein BDD12DRAFT_868731 [Trichophaea hybrida]